MPLFMDTHLQLPAGATSADVAAAHEADLRVQGKFQVNYINYWVDEERGRVWCLVDAPTPEAASAVHAEAHGLVADELRPVVQG